MNTAQIKINGALLSSMGATLLADAYGALLTPPGLKTFVENDDPSKPGVDVVVPDNPVVNERDVTLAFLIEGKSSDDFFKNYNKFVSELHKGAVKLEVPGLGLAFHLLYSSCTQYENYWLNACKLSVKFREPNPANRE